VATHKKKRTTKKNYVVTLGEYFAAAVSKNSFFSWISERRG
jgi:hypothetical protein